MDIPSANNIREVLRAENKQRRNNIRDNNLSSKRNIVKETICNQERIITQKEVQVIADNIKQKSKVNVNDLALLKLSFLQSSDNIIVFLKSKGALQSLVRELTGSSSNYQLAAAECLCNLALGSPKSSIQVCKAASPYLISHLQGLNYNLMNTCVWTLGNLAGSDLKSWEILRSQGLSQRLIQLLIVPELLDNALYAITQFLKVGLQQLDVTELGALASAIIKDFLDNRSFNSCLALYLISCSEFCENTLLENNVVEKCLTLIENCTVNADTVKCTTALVRTVANLIPEKSGIVVANVLENWEQMKKIINNLLVSSYSHFKLELIWLVGNIVNHPSIAVREVIENNSEQFICLFK